MRPGYAGTITNLQNVLNTQKNPYLNQATQKNTCQIFLPKKIPESKLSNPKKSFNHPCHLKSGVPPPPSREVNLSLLAVSLLLSAFSALDCKLIMEFSTL